MILPAGKMKIDYLKNSAQRYSFAVAVSILAGLLTLWIIPDLNTHFYELFQAAVVISAWYGGVGPGILTATFSILVINYFFIPPRFEFVLGPSEFVRLLIFEAVAILTSLLSGKLKKSNAELKSAQDLLEARIVKRTEQLVEANKSLQHEISQRMEAEKAIMEISSREQRRLGQNLHDGLSQILAGVKFMVHGLKDALAERSVPEAKRMEIIESQLGEALSFVDTVSRGLYPVELEVNGLTAALKELAEKTSQVYPVACRFKCGSYISIDDSAVANHIYRIAQEMVINAVKSGKAKKINIRLFRSDANIHLCVADDGVGFGNKPLRKGMGIKMMEYRTRVINGALKFHSRPTGCTLVRCIFQRREENGL